jgi:hypothetical protein
MCAKSVGSGGQGVILHSPASDPARAIKARGKREVGRIDARRRVRVVPRVEPLKRRLKGRALCRIQDREAGGIRLKPRGVVSRQFGPQRDQPGGVVRLRPLAWPTP